jgi:hypothetical protein
MFPDLLDSTHHNFRCDKCGLPDREVGGPLPPEIAPFVQGQIVVNVRSIGVCLECYVLVCSACADRGRCPECGRMLFNPEYTPTRPSWIHPVKRLKWNRIFER